MVVSIDRWGPAGWKFLHAVALSAPAQTTASERHDYETFFRSVGAVLPCPRCRAHYRRAYEDRPTHTFDSKERMSRWLVQVHNDVNQRRGKRSFTYEEAVQVHTAPRSTHTYAWAILLLGLLVVILYRSLFRGSN